jgi:hypothetical protein
MTWLNKLQHELIHVKVPQMNGESFQVGELVWAPASCFLTMSLRFGTS